MNETKRSCTLAVFPGFPLNNTTALEKSPLIVAPSLVDMSPVLLLLYNLFRIGLIEFGIWQVAIISLSLIVPSGAPVVLYLFIRRRFWGGSIGKPLLACQAQLNHNRVLFPAPWGVQCF